jgi:hypothetical protein
MPTVKSHKTPSQLKGERYLRSKNLIVPPSVLRNTERAKYKARGIRLKEDYTRKYLTKRKSALAVSEGLIIAPDYIESTPSRLKRTLAFCIQLCFSLLAAIAICVFLGFLLRYILEKYKI